MVTREAGRCAQTTLILRVSRDGAGRVSGVVERVRTGEKARFRGLRAIGGLVARMCRTEEGGREPRG